MHDDVLLEFVTESREHLATIEEDLLRIEEEGENVGDALVNKVFRAAHSIKGGSAFFGLTKVKELAHKAETVLDMLRSRKMAPNAEVTNILLAAFDKLRDMINHTDESEEADIGDLLVSLVGLASSYLPTGQKEALQKETQLTSSRGDTFTLPQTDLDRAGRTGQFVYWVDCDLIHDIEQKGRSILALFNDLTASGEILDCTVDTAAVGTLDGPLSNRVPLRLVIATIMQPEHIGLLFDTIEPERIHLLFDPDKGEALQPLIPEEQLSPAPAPVEVPAPEPVPEKKPVPVSKPQPTRGAAATEATPAAGAPEETLRVNVALLETLMNLAGELVLSRNQLRAAVALNNRALLTSVDQRVNQVTSELQDVIMQTRMQPIGNVFSKFPRVVRDLSHALGKEIQLELVGKEVAMDKTLIEGISDPLTHMVRNAVDHGIEATEERRQAGKNPMGTVRIEARHEAGQVVVEISDDGKGIDPQRVAEMAVSKGLISEEKIRGLSERDKRALIFLPGLSTVQKVSEISGRGVGMDVVKTNLDRLGGQVEIVSETGKGSTFRIKLPLTLAIMPSLIVSVEKERFAIPQGNIEELLRLRPREFKNRIEMVGDREVLLLRDRMLPLARLADILGIVCTYTDARTSHPEIDRRVRLADRRSPRHTLGEAGAPQGPGETPSSRLHRNEDRRSAVGSTLEIAVVSTGTMSYGLVVGAFYDTEEVVVKPLGSRLKHLREYSGATILGDGTVTLILDMAGLAAKAGLTSVSGSARATRLALEAEAQRLQDFHSLLLFHNGPDEPCAIPLELVQRIERITPEQVERLGNQRTIQYRGNSLPLVTLSDAAPVGSLDGERDLVVLVSSTGGREFGLLGSMPVDVVETRTAIDQATHRRTGIAGSAILRDRTTLIVDLYELVDAIHPEWGAERTGPPVGGGSGETPWVLLAEDSDFFRSQIKKYLEEDGFHVLAEPDGEAAWETLQKNLETVGVVVTDIEMPRLNGLALAARIRGDERTTGLPIVALTSLAGDEDMARGLAAGVSDYQVKLDRDRLLVSVRTLLGVGRGEALGIRD